MRTFLICCGFLLFLASDQPCWSQFIRIPVRVPVRVPVRAPHIPHIPIHPISGSKHAATHAATDKSTEKSDVWLWVGVVVAGFAGVGVTWYLVHKWRAKMTPRARVRIIALPPGEAPDWVRAYWVGLELPLVIGQVCAVAGPAQQVLSRAPVMVAGGYAVDGKAAVEILESANIAAGHWWRTNAPDVLAPGSQIVFPAYVCERLDDLG